MITKEYVEATNIIHELCMQCALCKHDTKTKKCRHFKKLHEEVRMACGYVGKPKSKHIVKLDREVFDNNWCLKFRSK